MAINQLCAACGGTWPLGCISFGPGSWLRLKIWKWAAGKSRRAMRWGLCANPCRWFKALVKGIWKKWSCRSLLMCDKDGWKLIASISVENQRFYQWDNRPRCDCSWSRPIMTPGDATSDCLAVSSQSFHISAGEEEVGGLGVGLWIVVILASSIIIHKIMHAWYSKCILAEPKSIIWTV